MSITNLFVGLIIGLNIQILTLSYASAAEGFTRIGDAELPAPVRLASRSVFKIWYDSPYNQSEGQPLSTYATGFLLDRSDTIVTVRHFIDLVIEDWLSDPDNMTLFQEQEEKSGPLALTELVRSGRLPMKFRITDFEGKPLFSNQANAEVIAVNTYFDPTAFLQNIYHPSFFWTEVLGDGESYKKVFSDTVVLRLPRRLNAAPLTLRNMRSNDTRLFGIGFPGVSKNRGNNSDGVSMYVSSGSRISTKDALAKAGRKKLLSEPQDALFRQAAFYTDIDAVAGSSGSPIIAVDGGVIGMALAIPGLKAKSQGTYKVTFDDYTGAGAMVISAAWMDVLRSLDSGKRLKKFRTKQLTIADKTLVNWTASECFARREKQELSAFLEKSAATFPHGKLIVDSLSRSKICPVGAMSAPENASKNSPSVPVKGPVDQDGFAVFQDNVTGLSGCYKPVGPNAKLYPWSQLVLVNDSEVDCSPDGVSCLGGITLFDESGKSTNELDYSVIGNNLASGMGQIAFAKEKQAPEMLMITRFKSDAANRIVAFEAILPEAGVPAWLGTKRISFESCSR